MSTYKNDYFLPGQLILHVEHRKSLHLSPLDIKTAVDDFLKDVEKILPRWLGQFASPAHTSIINFPIPRMIDDDNYIISLVPLDMVKTAENFDDGKKKWEDQSITDLIDLALDMYNRLTPHGVLTPIPLSDDILLHTVSPNWLFGATHHLSNATGGPGSRPIQAYPKANKPGEINIPKASGIIDDTIGTNEGGGVDVVILDTAPFDNDIQAAETNNSWKDHWLINDLLRKKELSIHYHNEWYDWQSLENYKHLKPYQMPDHGLFIAGIIHSIAPKAELYLYEVLNQYGVGSLESIARGLSIALEHFEKRKQDKPQQKLIINCSFILHNSVVGDDGKFKHEKDVGFPDNLYYPKIIDHMNTSFRRIIENTLENDIENTLESGLVVVAAAGNDSHEFRPQTSNPPLIDLDTHPGRLPARYPAAFKNVIGVGAMPRYTKSPQGSLPGKEKPKHATYSNLSDVPPGSGFVTLGGEDGDGNGVLGVYIHKFPQRGKATNYTGWAWWAGTSFAAAIVSGILAKAAGAGKVRSAQTAHDCLSGRSTTVTTEDNEKVIPVEQPIEQT